MTTGRVFHTFHRRRRRGRGFSLLETTIAIGLLLALTGAGFLTITPYLEWRRGREASAILHTVRAAQVQYLAGHPEAEVSRLTEADLAPYLPAGWKKSGVPPLPGRDGGRALSVKVNVFPAAASPGDPSGSDSDGLWDTGSP